MLPFKSVTSSPDTWSTIKFHLSATLPSPAEQPLVSFVQLHPLHEMHVRIELIVARYPSSRLFFPASNPFYSQTETCMTPRASNSKSSCRPCKRFPTSEVLSSRILLLNDGLSIRSSTYFLFGRRPGFCGVFFFICISRVSTFPNSSNGFSL